MESEEGGRKKIIIKHFYCAATTDWFYSVKSKCEVERKKQNKNLDNYVLNVGKIVYGICSIPNRLNESTNPILPRRRNKKE